MESVPRLSLDTINQGLTTQEKTTQKLINKINKLLNTNYFGLFI